MTLLVAISLLEFQSGSTTRTDGWSGYSDLKSLGYNHEVTVVSTSENQAQVSIPGVHNIAALLKPLILGTYHLQGYLEEFTFRFNRRRSKYRGLVFRRLLEQAVITSPITEKDVTYGYNWEQEELTNQPFKL